MTGGPDHRLAIERYRKHAPRYDASAARTMPLRRQPIERLGLRQGDAVLDVGCGTGLSFSLLASGVGAAGRVVGVELSPAMARLAREQVAAASWTNVRLVEAAVEDAALPRPFDAVLFNFTHDVLQSPVALARIFAAGCARGGIRLQAPAAVARAGQCARAADQCAVHDDLRGIGPAVAPSRAGYGSGSARALGPLGRRVRGVRPLSADAPRRWVRWQNSVVIGLKIAGHRLVALDAREGLD
jgi:SAM-dependent methyltransferase